ncbi:MAG: Crp/Fnr family transcriptional regulator [Acidobacteria bacterium]|nr:Crp/Fnr family transcriptional regulator [Acidobacteriota bacterium]
MPRGQLLYQPWKKIQYIYFPETSVISTVTMLENGSGVESGIIGREGVLGASIIFAKDVSASEAVIQLDGEGLRMEALTFKDIFEENKDFRKMILFYVYAFIVQISQNAVCLCYHHLEKRLARWLLMLDDRSDGNKLFLTQDFIAQMLGVHRPSISKNANKLQNLELISYNRGSIKILDRDGLEKLACECYKVINNAFSGYTNSKCFNSFPRQTIYE